MLNFFRIVFKGNIFIAVISMITGILLARTLDSDGRGELSIIVTYATLISTLSSFSIPEAIVKKNDKELNLFTASFLMIIVCIVASGFSIFAKLAVEDEVFFGICNYLIYFIPINFLCAYLIGFLQSQSRFKELTWVRVLMPLSSAVLILA